MDITIAGKFDYDIPTIAGTLKIPPSIYKSIIQKLFGMGSWRPIPDKIAFVEISKLYPVSSTIAKPIDGPVLINGVDTVVVGLREGQGTSEATVTSYICKAAKSVMDLSTWADQMDARLK